MPTTRILCSDVAAAGLPANAPIHFVPVGGMVGTVGASVRLPETVYAAAVDGVLTYTGTDRQPGDGQAGVPLEQTGAWTNGGWARYRVVVPNVNGNQPVQDFFIHVPASSTAQLADVIAAQTPSGGWVTKGDRGDPPTLAISSSGSEPYGTGAAVTATETAPGEYEVDVRPEQGAPGGSDAATAGWISGGAQTQAALTQRLSVNEYAARHIKSFGAVGNKTTNDTAAVQAAFDYAAANGIELYSDPRTVLLVDELTAPGGLVLSGDWNFKARTAGQRSVLYHTRPSGNALLSGGRVDWSKASIDIDGAGKAKSGVLSQYFSRSFIGSLKVSNCLLWGWQWNPVGNNNAVTVSKFAGSTLGGSTTCVGTSAVVTGNPATSTTGYVTFNLDTTLPTHYLDPHAVYFVLSGGKPYKVKSVPSQTSIEVYNLNISVGSTVSMEVVAGGGANITSFGDNGVGTWGSVDVVGSGIGVQQDSLYGHHFANPVFQANKIGYACASYTTQTTLVKPYFENNTVNYVSHLYVRGAMLAPVMDLSTIYNIKNSLVGNPAYDDSLVIFQDRVPTIASDLTPSLNPGGRIVRPGQHYHYHRSASGAWNFTLDNGPQHAALGAHAVHLTLSHASTATRGDLTIGLGNSNGDTIEGGSTFTATVTGKSDVWCYRVGTDWKVSVSANRTPATTITAAPFYVGQTAVVGGVGYLATGTASAADWKQITN